MHYAISPDEVFRDGQLPFAMQNTGDNGILVHPAEMAAQKLNSFDECTQIAQVFVNHLARKDEFMSNRPDKYEPTLVQQYAYPFLANGNSVMVRAPTGSGKTIAFLLPIIERLIREGPNVKKNPRCIVIMDTKDLCEQHWKTTSSILDELNAIGKDISIECYVGGLNRGEKRYDVEVPFGRLTDGLVLCDIAFISMGKLCDFLGGYMRHLENATTRKRLDLSDLQYIVIDEADEVFFPGKFMDELKVFTQELERCRQIKGPNYRPSLSMFSATLFPQDLNFQESCKKLGPDYHVDKMGYIALDCFKPNIIQRVLKFNGMQEKLVALLRLLDQDLKANETTRENSFTHPRFNFSTVIFCDTKKTVYFLAAYLTIRKFYVKFHCSTLPEHLRRRNRDLLDAGRIPILITTNSFARGIDKPNIKHVILFDLPQTNWHSYTHRVGRTGRSGTTGYATILFDATRHADISSGGRLLRALYMTKQKLPKFLFDAFAEGVFSESFIELVRQGQTQKNVEEPDNYYSDSESHGSTLSLALLQPAEDEENDEELASNMTSVLPEEEDLVVDFTMDMNTKSPFSKTGSNTSNLINCEGKTANWLRIVKAGEAASDPLESDSTCSTMCDAPSIFSEGEISVYSDRTNMTGVKFGVRNLKLMLAAKKDSSDTSIARLQK